MCRKVVSVRLGSVFPQVGQVWGEGGGGWREVEQTTCVHAVSAQSVRAAHLPADRLRSAGPGGVFTAADSGSVHRTARKHQRTDLSSVLTLQNSCYLLSSKILLINIPFYQYTLLFKGFILERNYPQACIKLIKSGSKDIYDVTSDFGSSKNPF